MVPLPPGLSPDGSSHRPPSGSGPEAAPVGRRLAEYGKSADVGVLLEAGAESDAVTLLDTSVRTVMRELSIDPQRTLAVLAATGWLFWLRSLCGPQRNPLYERDLALALALLAPLRDAEPESVPEPVSASLPPPPRPGDPQIGSWNDMVGALLEECGTHDRTALLGAVAVLQLGAGMSDGGRHHARCLGNTVHALTLLHEHRADPELLTGAVRLARMVVAEVPHGSPEHARQLGRLSETLRHVYVAERSHEVLAEAIDLARRAVAGLPPAHPGRPDRLTNLAGMLRLRYDDNGDSQSLREAVAVSRTLVAELSPDHPGLARYLNNLATHLHLLSSFDEENDANGKNTDTALLDEIITLGRSGLSATAGSGSVPELRTTLLANLSRWLTQRAQRAGGAHDPAEDLAEALRLARQACAATPGRPLGVVLDALTDSLSAQYARTHDPAALTEAIAHVREGVDDAPNPAELASRRFTLGTLLGFRFTDFGESADAREAAVHFGAVARSTTETVGRRVESAWRSGKLAIALEDWHNAAEDLALAVSLLPGLAAWQLRADDRQRLLSAYMTLPTLAASCAVAAADPERALELLEQGRGVLHAETAAVRVHVDRLRAQAPRLASALEELPKRLQSTQDADRRHQLADERRQLIEEIRSMPGFGDFLSPPRVADILSMCRSGPVVVPVFGRYRSDALIVTKDGVRRLPLPRLTGHTFSLLTRELLVGAELALDAQSSPTQRTTAEYSLRTGLSRLWDTVVGPVLQALRDDLQGLGTTAPHSTTGSELPRMWWCPTGPLAYFPLHMAGSHEEAHAFDLVLSSYTPTINALGRARPWRPGPDSRPLVVAMPRTPGAPDLPAAEHEAALLASLFPDVRLLRGRAAEHERVKTTIADHDIVHIACHTVHDPGRRGEGHLLLHDGRLSFADIAAARTGRAGLAFLSACGTARSRFDLPDESLNLATAFQLAGFSQLVGSLWPVTDRASTHLVEGFYEHMTTHDDATVAHSLHHAVSRLRTRYPDRPSLWAPHVHIGR